MQWLRKRRMTLGTVMMLVLTAAAASALFAKVKKYSEDPTRPTWKYDSPILVTMAIGMTAVALGAMKRHTASQTMLQATIAFLGYYSLIQLAEGGWLRVLLYWFQAGFALLVALPLLARRLVKADMDPGPRREWWKRTFEALVFSFLNMLLCTVGVAIQFLGALLGNQMLGKGGNP